MIELSYELGPEFENQVMSAILTDGAFFLRFRSIISPEIFTQENHRCLIEEINKYVKRYKKTPSKHILVECIRRATYRDKGGMVELVKHAKVCENIEYIRSRILEWAKWSAIDRILKGFTDMSETTPTEFAQQLEKASRIGDDLIMEHTNLQHGDTMDVGGIHIPTPWSWLNSRLNGGPEIGDLCVILSVVNGGKTTALVNLAYQALAMGKFVVYFTFEDGEQKIKRRLLQRMMNQTIEDMVKDPIYTRRRRAKFLKDTGARCEIKDLSSRRSTVEDAAGFIKTLEETSGRKVDMVITDYADRFKATNKYNEPRHALREIFEDCKWLARNLKVVHWTARQANKARVGKDVVSIEHASESSGSMESPDLVLGLGRTLEDERLGRVTLYMGKTRDAESHQRCSLMVDFSRQSMLEME